MKDNPNKHTHRRNLTPLPPEFAALVKISYIEHYGQQKLVDKLENGIHFIWLQIIWRDGKAVTRRLKNN